ncbi:MAG: ABC transporter substrate-binding protein [Xanthomonadaceae bacterium]|nr:ABC transporter substrate-binding protein [Xanthomonadaceae bacterium]
MSPSRSVARVGPRLVMVFCVLASLGASLWPADQASSAELILSGSQKIIDAPTRIAAAAGYFDADTGPRIRVELADSGTQSLEMLMAGDADFALMTAVPLSQTLVRLHHDDAPAATWPVVVASIGFSSRIHHVIVNAGSGIEQPAELAGHALGLTFDTSAHFAWDWFADLHGIGTDAVRLVDTRPGELGEGLAAGRFDAVVAWTPYSENIMDQRGASARRFPLQAMDSVSWLLVSRRALVERHPEIVERVLRAYAGAIDLLHTDPDGAAELLDLPRDWPQGKHVAWKLALNWPVIANLEAKLVWSARRSGVAALHVSPSSYIARGPLERFRSHAVSLPTWIAAGQAEQ